MKYAARPSIIVRPAHLHRSDTRSLPPRLNLVAISFFRLWYFRRAVKGAKYYIFIFVPIESPTQNLLF